MTIMKKNTTRRRPLADRLKTLARTPAPEPMTPTLTENLGRGRVLYVADVHELLRQKQTMAWIVRNFAPQAKRKLGRRPFWFEADAIEWLDRQTGGGA